jgi:hypothetical protein
VGLWLMQNAFSSGPLHSSLPTIAAGEPVAGIALGIVVFGDRIQISPGPLAIEAGGIAALIVGVVMVASSSAFSGLRKITETIKQDVGGPADRPQGTALPRQDPVGLRKDPTRIRKDPTRPRKDPVGPRKDPARPRKAT